MALLVIDGLALANPSSYSVSVMDINKAERDANGDMFIQRIATKRKIEVSYSVLTQSEVAVILSSVSATTFSVTYLDTVTGATRTSNFYCGDRSSSGIKYVGGIMYYKDTKFNLIEI